MIFQNWFLNYFFCLYQKSELSKLENGELKRVKAEVNKLRELQLSQKDSYESEVQGLKVEISRLTKDLHDRTKTMSDLSEESGQMEAQLRNEVEAQERRQAELQVCSKLGTVWAVFFHCNHAPTHFITSTQNARYIFSISLVIFLRIFILHKFLLSLTF